MQSLLDLMYRLSERNMDCLASSGKNIQSHFNFSDARNRTRRFQSVLCKTGFYDMMNRSLLDDLLEMLPAGGRATLDSVKRSSVRAQTHCGTWTVFDG